jgi:hypothetical protein
VYVGTQTELWVGNSSFITKINLEDGGSTVSETLVSKHQIKWRNNAENHDFKVTLLFFLLSNAVNIYI